VDQDECVSSPTNGETETSGSWEARLKGRQSSALLPCTALLLPAWQRENASETFCRLTLPWPAVGTWIGQAFDYCLAIVDGVAGAVMGEGGWLGVCSPGT
jgi:hypothetical protein